MDSRSRARTAATWLIVLASLKRYAPRVPLLFASPNPRVPHHTAKIAHATDLRLPHGDARGQHVRQIETATTKVVQNAPCTAGLIISLP